MEEKNPFEVGVEFGNTSASVEQPALTISAPVNIQIFGVTEMSSSLDEAFEIIKAHLDGYAPFTNAQLDVCTQVVATQLPQTEREMLAEIAEQNKYPLWVGLLAQWRRCVEYSEQYAILEDPDWQKKIDERQQELNGAVVVVDDNGSAKG